MTTKVEETEEKKEGGTKEMKAFELKLEREWTLWHDRKDAKPAKNRKIASAGEWTEGVKEVSKVRTVGEFWVLWKMMPKPSMMAKGNSFSLFESGVTPTWEDRKNEGGGRWSLVVKHGAGFESADGIWLDTLLAMIGEQLGGGVIGCVVNVRDGYDRICIWLNRRGCEQRDRIIRIGRAWHQSISKANVEIIHQINFQLHRSVTVLVTL